MIDDLTTAAIKELKTSNDMNVEYEPFNQAYKTPLQIFYSCK